MSRPFQGLPGLVSCDFGRRKTLQGAFREADKLSSKRYFTRGHSIMKKTYLFAALILALTAAMPVHAQFGGCSDSPENPTLVLAGLASGAFALSSVRTRLRARRSLKK